MSDNVNHPSHYETGKFECIDVMVETQGVQATKDFCLCNALKYIYRHRRKNGLEDIQKAIWYLNKAVELDGQIKELMTVEQSGKANPVTWRTEVMRKFKRMIARANMKRAGYTRLNKKGGDGRSTFAKLWKQYI
nr:MAG: protein of unknown function DUF3310 [Bacteriophage sp.]